MALKVDKEFVCEFSVEIQVLHNSTWQTLFGALCVNHMHTILMAVAYIITEELIAHQQAPNLPDRISLTLTESLNSVDGLVFWRYGTGGGRFELYLTLCAKA